MSADVLSFGPRRCVVIRSTEITASTNPTMIGQPMLFVTYVRSDGSEESGVIEWDRNDAYLTATDLAARYRCGIRDLTGTEGAR